MTESVLLAVDLSNQVYRACAVHPTLQSEGRYTGGLFGFIVALTKAIQATKATHVVLCQDRKPYLRSKAYPEYKLLRTDTKDEELVEHARQTMQLIHLLATAVDLPIWGIDGFESDDLIAFCVTKYRNRFSRIVAVSNDSDLYQLFWSPKFSIWKGSKHGFYDQNKFFKEWGMSPEWYITALALTGTHNEIQGIEGVGPVTAKEAIWQPSKLRALREKHADLIERNVALITLPHPEFPKDVTLPRRTKQFNDRAFIRFCAQYDIEVIKPMLDAFNQLVS